MRQNKKYDDGEISLRKSLEQLNARYFKSETQEGSLAGENQGADILKSKEIPSIKQSKADAPGKVKRMTLWMKLAVAAGIIGIVFLGVIRYLEKADNSDVSIANQIADSSKKANIQDSSFLNNSIPLNNIAQKDEDKNQNKKGTQIIEVKPAILFADNFKPDAVPADKEGPLEDAFIYYENKNYQQAIAAIDGADLTIVTRDEESDQKLTAFYASYYKGLSYIAVKNIKKQYPN